ncbi:MAG: hypothetical protein MRY83_01070 [Flavobacteriales bacterium]|nr:hypothetical protein [Flavobacteriales bacterium]
MTDESKKTLDQLQEIRSLMERSSRFISLSGLSGVFAGVVALVGAYFAKNYIDINFSGNLERVNPRYYSTEQIVDGALYLGALGLLIVIVAVIGGVFFTFRKSKKTDQPVWGSASWRMIINLLIPLASGGFFCIVLMSYNMWILVAPTTLIFYGLSLIHGSKYTLNDIRYLGVLEIILGFLGCVFPGHGLIIWAIGFGILHIVYGAYMYLKYERNA